MKHSDKKPLGCGGTYVAIMSSLVFAGLLYQAIKNPGRQTLIPVVGAFLILALVILFRYLKS
jgi:hypothetical protein